MNRIAILAALLSFVGCTVGAEADRPLPQDHPAHPQASEDSYVPPRNPFQGELTTVTPVTPEGSGAYTCPMHPEVQSPKPGDCPKCGMKLEPKKE